MRVNRVGGSGLVIALLAVAWGWGSSAAQGGTCPVTCPAGAVAEGESACTDFSVACVIPADCPGGEPCVDGFCGFVDHANGGCDGPDALFETLACGQEYCGTSGTFCGANCSCVPPEDVNADGDIDLLDILCVLDVLMGTPGGCTFQQADVRPCGGNGVLNLLDIGAVLNFFADNISCCGFRDERDTDWYQFELTQDTLVTLSGSADFAVRYELFSTTSFGADACGKRRPVASMVVDSCAPGTIEKCLLAGKYLVRVAPVEGTRPACGAAYTLRMDCGDCAALCGPGGGDCCDELANGTPGCEDAGCCATVCATQPSCCSVDWDASCAKLARSICSACPPPASDDCVNAEVVLVPSTLPGTTIGATVDAARTCSNVVVDSPGVWYRVIGTGNRMTATLCNTPQVIRADFDAKLTVYCGGCDLQNCVTANNQRLGCSNFTPRVDWCGELGQEYFILVHAAFQEEGDFTLDVFDDGTPCTNVPDCGVPVCGDGIISLGEECDDGNQLPGDGCDPNCMFEPPANDLCDNAFTVTPADLPLEYTTNGAVSDGPAHDGCLFQSNSQVFNDVWFDYVAPCTGTMTVQTCGSFFDTKLAVYQGCTCPVTDQMLAGCDDDFCGLQDRVIVSSVLGQCYKIRAGSKLAGTSGDGFLSIQCESVVPNGACCQAGQCIGTMPEQQCLDAGGDWTIGEDCNSFVCVPPFDECAGRLNLGCNVQLEIDNTNATSGPNDQSASPDCWIPKLSGFGTSYVSFVAETPTMRIRTTAALPGVVDDNELVVFSVDQVDPCNTAFWMELGCNQDGGAGFLADVCLDNLIIGDTYIIQFSSVGAGQQGVYTLISECPAPGGSCTP